MATVSPVVASTRSIVAYLETALRAIPGLGDSRAIESWPEPTSDLQLSDTRVLVAVTTPNAPERTRLGPPEFVKKSSSTTLRYDLGKTDFSMMLGLWACTKALRDEVDIKITSLINRAYWQTVALNVSTTLSVAITQTGEQWITPVSMTNITPGKTLRLSGTENVVVSKISPTQFRASPKRTHLASATVVQQKGGRNYSSGGLHLALPDHFGVVARYIFEEPQLLDAPGRAQKQEWLSMREGRVFSPSIIEVDGVVQDSTNITPEWT